MTQFEQFLNLVRARLEQGAKDYGQVELPGGDPRTMDAIIGEIEQEVLDVVGWAGVGWLKLQSLKAKVDQVNPQPKGNPALSLTVDALELSGRYKNALRRVTARTLGELVEKEECELLSYRHIGEKALHEIKIALAKLGLHLRVPMTPAELLKFAAGKHDRSKLLVQPVEALDLSVRSYNCLDSENIRTIGELIQCTARDLHKVRNLGKTSLTEIRTKLESLGLTLADGVSASQAREDLRAERRKAAERKAAVAAGLKENLSPYVDMDGKHILAGRRATYYSGHLAKPCVIVRTQTQVRTTYKKGWMVYVQFTDTNESMNVPSYMLKMDPSDVLPTPQDP